MVAIPSDPALRVVQEARIRMQKPKPSVSGVHRAWKRQESKIERWVKVVVFGILAAAVVMDLVIGWLLRDRIWAFLVK